MQVIQTNAAVAEQDCDSLAELARAAACGDADAFAGIYELLSGDVYAYVRAQSSSDDACEDIVAEVFLKAWKGARSQDSVNFGYRSWIFTIARNEIQDYWRREGRFGNVITDIVKEPRDVPEEEADEAAIRRLVASSLTVLTDDQRDVVMLRILAGLSTQEVSRMLETNEGAVRALQFRALRRMRAASLNGAGS